MLTGRVCWSQQVSQVRLAVTGALVVFCLTYLVIASRQLHVLKLDRPAGAVVGAVAMVIVGGLPMDYALRAIDLHVLLLLFGVLVIAAYLQEAQFVSNVPLVLVAVGWIPYMPEPTWGYIMLAAASTLAGNLTLFGSVANIIVMETAGPRGEISFWRFLRYGSLITVVDLALAFGILALERAAGIPALLGL
jgi:Na+/H+ antiporter NhaD/arsenite permease-like protein